MADRKTLGILCNHQLTYPEGKCFKFCDFTAIDLHRCDLSELEFADCIFDGASFAHANLHYVRFNRCVFMGAQFDKASLQHAEFSYCRLDDATFRNADMSHAILSFTTAIDTDFTGVNFTGAYLKNLLLHKTIFKEATLHYDQIAPYDHSCPGRLTAYFRFMDGRIMQVEIPEDAQRCAILGAAYRAFRVDRAIPKTLYDCEGYPVKGGKENYKVFIDKKYNPDWRDPTIPGITVYPTLEEALRAGINIREICE